MGFMGASGRSASGPANAFSSLAPPAVAGGSYLRCSRRSLAASRGCLQRKRASWAWRLEARASSARLVAAAARVGLARSQRTSTSPSALGPPQRSSPWCCRILCRPRTLLPGTKSAPGNHAHLLFSLRMLATTSERAARRDQMSECCPCLDRHSCPAMQP
eukprot:755805-Hanusia_phi.AAC.2